jgi:predicted solute-binding protein
MEHCVAHTVVGCRGLTTFSIIDSLERSLASAAGNFGALGREHGARLGMSEAEVSDYLSQFRYRFSIDEHAAMAEFEMEYAKLGVEQAFSLSADF